jgi:hypothetical protein
LGRKRYLDAAFGRSIKIWFYRCYIQQVLGISENKRRNIFKSLPIDYQGKFS